MKVRQTRFANGSQMWDMKERKESRVTSVWSRETGRSREEFSFEHVEFEMCIRSVSGTIKGVVR